MSHSPALAGLLLSAVATLFVGCQSTCTGNPSTDGYLCAKQGLSSGTYGVRTASLGAIARQRQAEAEMASGSATHAHRSADRARTAAADLQQRADEQNAELARLRGDLERAEIRLTSLRNGGSPEDIAALEAEIASLQGQIAILSPAAN